MREIKYRLLKDGKIVGYEKHVERVGIIHIFHSILNDDTEGWEWNNIIHHGFIYHDNKEQFTGLQDSKGNDLFEGDIVHHHRCVDARDEDGSFDVYLTRHGRITITASNGVTLNGWFKTEYDNGDPTDMNRSWSGYCSCMEKYGEIIGNIHEGTTK